VAVDEVEFREFFASQYVRLCWLGLLLTGDRAEAEELAQEALARTWWRSRPGVGVHAEDIEPVFLLNGQLMVLRPRSGRPAGPPTSARRCPAAPG
jgi:hypothetical protein